ncbi:MAG: DUF3291 domain-containing protein, partial [Pseudomonadota bacterium]
NVVRPLGAIAADNVERRYFFEQVQDIFDIAKTTEGLIWHNHGLRRSDGIYLELLDLVTIETDGADNPYVMTMAGWRDVKAMHAFSHRMRRHVDGMKALRHWVDRSEGPTMVMWWSRKGERVELEAAWDRLQKLRTNGPTPEAFTLQTRFDAPSRAA